jgi:hypothetical protein
VSWLLAVLIPGLLMLATFGLERLESALESGDEDDDPIAELVVYTPPRVERAHRADHPPHIGHLTPPPHSCAALSGLAAFSDEPGLPTRMHRHDAGNPQFPPTRQANPV